ncbi:MAG: hypothetical protein K6B13_01765 [Prevotella sp.]|nr:hypothetical protein [Prevotella sp.]
MKHKYLSHILQHVGAVIMAALAIIVLFACNGKHKHSDDDEDEDEIEVTGTLQVGDALLNAFNPNVPFEQKGHSRAFKVKPREDMIVSAEAGAFERDVNIRVTDVPAATMDALDRQLEGSGTTMIFAYDLDAGLPSDSVIPGKYTVSIDLRKHNIPEELYPHFVMYRVDGDGSLQPLNVRIKGHTATYMASQNSITFAAIAIITVKVALGAAAVGTAAYVVSRYPAISQTIRRRVDAGVWPSSWWKWDDAVFLHVEDDFGNFYVSYRYSMTENGDRAEEYVAKKKDLVKIEKQMRKDATEKYDQEHPQRFRGWFDSKEEEEKRRIGREAEYYNLLSNSPKVQELANDELFNTPRSVNDIIMASKLAHRYCRTMQHMKPLSYEYVIYLTPPLEAWKQDACRFQIPIYDPCLIINYKNIVVNGKYKEKTYWTSLSKLAHETMHLYQMEYVLCSLFKDDRYLEATGALIEPHFTQWLIDLNIGVPLTDAFSKKASDLMGYTERYEKQLLSSPLDKRTPSYSGVDLVQHTCGYMLADLMQYLWDHQPNPRDTLDFAKMMNRYALHKGVVKSFEDIFGIEDDLAFTKYYEGFCQKFINDIEGKQHAYRLQNAGDHLVMPNVEHTPDHCVMRVKNLGEKGSQTGFPFMVNTFRIIAKVPSREVPRQRYNLMAVASEKVKPSEIKFTFLDGDHFTEDPMCFVAPQRPPICGYATVMTRPDSKGLTMGDNYYFDIVALYQPTATPEIKGPSLDKKGLVVKPKCTPPEELKDKGYVTGLQVVMVNNKTDNMVSYVDKVKDWKNEFVADYDRLGVSDSADIDISLRSRWYYETKQGQRYFSPATDIVNYRRQRNRVEQHIEQDTTVVADDPGIEGDDDHGLAGLLADDDYYLLMWGGEIGDIFPKEGESTHSGDREVKIHLKAWADGAFTIDVPAINFTETETNGSGVMKYTYTDIHIEGKGTFKGTDESQYFEIANITMPMQTFHLNMNGDRKDEEGRNVHVNVDFYFDVKSGNGAHVVLGNDRSSGKIDKFGIEIPHVMMKIRGSGGGENEQGERPFTFVLGGQQTPPERFY